MILLVDIGNTSTKVKYNNVGEVRRFAHDAVPWQQLLCDVLEVRLSCVGPEPHELLALASERNIPLIRCTWDSPLVKRFLPAIPAGLGADRVAAILGAMTTQPGKPVLVIDSGTCLTTDLVSASGEHLGGIISPGLGLRLKAMHEHTAALPLVPSEGSAPILAFTTEEAMRGGAVNGLRFEIEGYITHIMVLHPDVVVFYTGGDELSLSVPVIYDGDLIMKGLEALLPIS